MELLTFTKVRTFTRCRFPFMCKTSLFWLTTHVIFRLNAHWWWSTRGMYCVAQLVVCVCVWVCVCTYTINCLHIKECSNRRGALAAVNWHAGVAVLYAARIVYFYKRSLVIIYFIYMQTGILKRERVDGKQINFCCWSERSSQGEIL